MRPLSKKDIAIGKYIENNSIEHAVKQFGQAYSTIERTGRRYRAELRAKEEFIPIIPKILIFDIENAPISAYVWNIWKDTAGVQGIVSDWFMISWSAKWLFEPEIFSDVLTSKEALKENDKRITLSLWKLIDQADVVIAHNGDRFDIPKMNTRFLMHGKNPPSPYLSIDTLKVLKRNFAFSSNKLDYVNEMLGLGRKEETGGFKLWKDCMKGIKSALKKMDEYCKKDVGVLEELYVLLRPWIRSHPNLAVIAEMTEECCPTCLSTDIKDYGEYVTMVGRYDALRCNKCGAPSRRRKSNISKEDRKQLLASTAR